MYKITKFPPSEVRQQEKFKAWPGGGWGLDSLERYLNSSPLPGFDVVCIKSDGGGDATILWESSKWKELQAAAAELVAYRQSAGPLNFQLEKADDFIRRLRSALEAP